MDSNLYNFLELLSGTAEAIEAEKEIRTELFNEYIQLFFENYDDIHNQFNGLYINSLHTNDHVLSENLRKLNNELDSLYKYLNNKYNQ